MGTQKAYAVLIQDLATETDQLEKGKIKVTPMNYLNSDNPGVYGYAFATTKPVSFTNGDVKKTQFTSGAWATVDGVDLLAPVKKIINFFIHKFKFKKNPEVV